MNNFLRVKQAQVIAALIMAIVVWVTTVGLGLNTGITGAAPVASKFNTGIAGAAFLNHRDAQKVPLWNPQRAQRVELTRLNRNCSGTIVPPPPSDLLEHGFSIISETESKPERLIAVVVLRNATPNATYNIRLIQTPNTLAACPGSNGTLTTNAQGSGNAIIRAFVQRGSSDAFVALNNLANPDKDFFTTEEVFFR
ncbi:hypothetical protein ccbrp13_22950 [Ktedonobacteria bacterium brp13]|nr:hypothetical protein ccbrp13_22950 [Ktedonobacteria bacterium brp13]